MEIKIKDLVKSEQRAVRNILCSYGWDGRKVVIYKEFETVVIEHKENGKQIKIEDISKAIYQN